VLSLTCMKKTSFNPVFVTSKLLKVLEERPRDILVKRFGLNLNAPKTLESIGKQYDITRERVRQIEAFALNKIRQSDQFSCIQNAVDELKNCIEEEGGLVHENEFLSSRSKQKEHEPHLLFLLVLGDNFKKLKEDDDFYHSWTTDVEKAGETRDALKRLHSNVDENTLLSENEMLSLFKDYLQKPLRDKLENEGLLSLLKISRVVSFNALGEWGHAFSSFIKPRGMKDCAFLIMRRHGSPMHFSEVAGAIGEVFKKSAHIQTVHNELIKDQRFILVGRGLYALKEWGYEGGIVRNVIEKVLSDNGPLSKEEITKKVLKERYVKENTVLVNLQNRNFFRKDEQGNFTLL